MLLLPFFFIGGPGSYGPRSFVAFWNLGHIVFFFLFIYLLTEYRQVSVSLGWVGKSLLLVFALGLLVELIQGGLVGRTVSLLDVVRDLVGAMLALIFLGWQEAGRKRNYLLIIAGLIVLVAITPLSLAVIDEYKAKAALPILGDFETSLELGRWESDGELTLVSEPVRHGKGALAVELSTAAYSGLSLQYFPSDWRGMKYLQMAINNQQNQELSITIRIHDNQHAEQEEQLYSDRFNRSFSLKPGWNEIEISLADIENAPTKRAMDIDMIRNMRIFVVRQREPKNIVIDFVRLVS